MTSPFPQLLRRSKFATHDGVITRVYASTPSSVHQHGDWGMKFPIHRKEKGGPRYITVNQMDTGTILGSDWRSAEKEARFVENWGKAGRWTNRDIEAQKRASAMQAAGPGGAGYERYAERDLRAEAAKHALGKDKQGRGQDEEVYVPDVNRMSRRQFEKYLATLRQHQLPEAGEEGAATAAKVEKATRGQASTSDAEHYRATLAHTQLMSPESTEIHSTPHITHGLAYSSPTASSSSSSTSGNSLSGRVVGRTPQQGYAYGHGYGRNNRADDDNRSWAVSLAGLSANLSNADRQVRDYGSRIEPVDYTRQEPERGEGRFQIRKAQINSPATVQYLQQRNAAQRWSPNGRDRVSGAKQASPLDTFTSDIILTDAGSGSGSEVPAAGSREWVGRDVSAAPRYTTEEDRFGAIGGPKAARTAGETVSMLGDMHRHEERKRQQNVSEQNKNVVTDLIARLRANNSKQ